MIGDVVKLKGDSTIRCNIISLMFSLQLGLFFGILVLGVLFLGCGKKSPPTIFLRQSLQPLQNLTSTLNENRVCLNWDRPKLSDKEEVATLNSEISKPDGFTLYRSKVLIEEECLGCPILFKRVGDVNPQLGIYCEPLTKGYRYQYKITSYVKNGNVTADSNIISLEY